MLYIVPMICAYAATLICSEICLKVPVLCFLMGTKPNKFWFLVQKPSIKIITYTHQSHEENLVAFSFLKIWIDSIYNTSGQIVHFIF